MSCPYCSGLSSGTISGCTGECRGEDGLLRVGRIEFGPLTDSVIRNDAPAPHATATFDPSKIEIHPGGLTVPPPAAASAPLDLRRTAAALAVYESAEPELLMLVDAIAAGPCLDAMWARVLEAFGLDTIHMDQHEKVDGVTVRFARKGASKKFLRELVQRYPGPTP